MKTLVKNTALKLFQPGPVSNSWILDLFLLGLRLLFGWLLLQTGLGKLMNLEQTAAFFSALNLPVPWVLSVLVGSLELAGGVLLACGLAGRAAAFLLACTMLGALGSAHLTEVLEGLEGLVSTTPFPYLLGLLCVLLLGAGRFSLDHCVVRRAHSR
jgi:putative oxidoreductase